jgi:hypothetical protein
VANRVAGCDMVATDSQTEKYKYKYNIVDFNDCVIILIVFYVYFDVSYINVLIDGMNKNENENVGSHPRLYHGVHRGPSVATHTCNSGHLCCHRPQNVWLTQDSLGQSAIILNQPLDIRLFLLVLYNTFGVK